MSVATALILFLNAVFNVVAWPRFYTRVANDPRARDDAGRPTTFLAVHRILVGIALVLAAASAVAGVAQLVG